VPGDVSADFSGSGTSTEADSGVSRSSLARSPSGSRASGAQGPCVPGAPGSELDPPAHGRAHDVAPPHSLAPRRGDPLPSLSADSSCTPRFSTPPAVHLPLSTELPRSSVADAANSADSGADSGDSSGSSVGCGSYSYCCTTAGTSPYTPTKWYFPSQRVH
jgi:hypothetical protein